MRTFGEPLLAAALFVAAGAGPAGAQSGTAPAPAATPIAIPTLAPVDPLTDAIVRAAAGVLGDLIARNRLAAENSAHGTVTYFHRYELQVRTATNTYRDVRLHPGTVIYPRGATPAGGTAVDVSGRGLPDGSLAADTITVLR